MIDDQKNPQEIFVHAIEFESVEEQQAFLDRACEGDDDLRAKIEGLIRSYQAAGSFLQKPIAKINEENPSKFWEAANASQDETTNSGNIAEELTEIGPYKLLQQIGEGGMGSVYMAQQEKPVKRRVALKVIKAGMDSKQVIGRFEAERQALAMMDHPNIARLLDVGTTESGRPYFVMELVKGIPITEYCDQKRLNIRQRLDLFTSVCNAVQHAHQKGIIHRDLKPSNILVAEYDEKVVPKIIDFGLAKALGQNLTDKTVFTQFGQVMGTLAYMSPEQSKMNALDVDTRTDIYALGVLLYELLTGSTPFDEKTFRDAALDQILKIIRDETPPKPSTRLSTGGTDPQIAPSRNTDLTKLGKLVRGDLDWIVMKALEKERSRRYDTANAFADDIDRYLKNEIIVARPPSARYKFGKFVKKNRGLVIASTLIAASLIAAIIGTSIGLYQQGRIARQKIEFANQQAASEKEKIRQQIEFANQQAAADKEKLRQQTEFANEQKRLKEEQIRLKRIAEDRADRAEKAELKSAWQGYAAKIKLAQTEWNDGDTKVAWNALNSCRWDLRGWEHDFLYTRFTQNQLKLNLSGHANFVTSVAFSPDGTQIVSGSYDNTIKVWSTFGGEEILTFNGHDSAVRCVAFSPDGTRVISGSRDKTIRVWDVVSGEEILTLEGHDGVVLSVAFSPDGTQIASGSNDNTVKVWNAKSGEETVTFTGHDSWVKCVAFSPDGTQIASGSDDYIIKLWKVSDGEETLTLKGHFSSVNSVAFSPDGTRIVSGGRDNTVRVWNAKSGEELLTIKGHTRPVNSVAFSPNGTRLVSGSYDHTLRVWNAKSGEEVFPLTGHTSSVSCVAFSPDGTQIVSGSYDHSLRVWHADRGEETLTLKGRDPAFSPDGKLIASVGQGNTIKVWHAETGKEVLTISGHGSAVSCVAYSPDGTRIASGSDDNTIKIWNAKSGEEMLTFTGHTSAVLSVAFSHDGTKIVSKSKGFHLQRMASGKEGNIKVWNAKSGEEMLSITENGLTDRSVAFSPDGTKIVSMSWRTNIKVWNAETGKEALTLSGHDNAVTCVAFSPDGTWIVSGSADDTVKVWNAKSGEEILTLIGHNSGVESVAFSPDGTQIVSGSYDNTIKVWSATNGLETLTLKGHNSGVRKVAFSPDGTRIVSGSNDNIIKLWNAANGERVRTLKGHTGGVSGVAFSPDGTRIVSATDNQPRNETIKVWDVTSGEEAVTLKGYTGSSSVAFSPDGTRIVSGSRNKTIKLWNAISGEVVLTLNGHTGRVSSVAFSPDGTRIVSGSRGNEFNRGGGDIEGSIKVWNATSGEEILIIKGQAKGVLSVAFSPDGTRIASGSDDNTIKVWNVISGEEVLTLNGHTGGVSSVAFSPDGTRIVSGSGDKTIKVWSAASGEEILTLNGHAGSVYSVAFSPDGTQIASGSEDKTIKLWDAVSGEELLTLTGHTHWVSSVAFSPDGTWIASGSADMTIKLWNVPGKRPVNNRPVSISRAHSNSSTQPDDMNYETFAEDLITLYDEDNDGKLSQAETKQMRQPLSAGVDVDKDGFITKAELLESWTGETRPSSRSQKKDDDQSQKSSQSTDRSRKFGLEIYVESLIKPYDEDKDGKLSQQEQKKMPRPPKGVDVDKDGFITKAEWVESLRSENRWSRRRPTKDDDRSQKSSRSTDRSRQSRFEPYVDDLMNKFDEDKDGKLSREEQKKMRRPPVGVDMDKDGFITKAELLENLSGENRSSSRRQKEDDDR